MGTLILEETEVRTGSTFEPNLTPTGLACAGIAVYSILWAFCPMLIIGFELDFFIVLLRTLVAYFSIPLYLALYIILKWLLSFYFGGNGGPPGPKLILILAVFALIFFLSTLTTDVIIYYKNVEAYTLFDYATLWDTVLGAYSLLVSVIVTVLSDQIK